MRSDFPANFSIAAAYGRPSLSSPARCVVPPRIVPLHHEFPCRTGERRFGVRLWLIENRERSGRAACTHEILAIVSIWLRKGDLTMGSQNFGKRRGTWKFTAIRDNFGVDRKPYRICEQSRGVCQSPSARTLTLQLRGSCISRPDLSLHSVVPEK
jgi:hypothetical protein